nr:unnamed protein product [Digitaria exilis]CAB3445348.1 unnamed protein product [Digitaria exilis]CAB3448606.1 unnamed protein product [Digitaria exilis]
MHSSAAGAAGAAGAPLLLHGDLDLTIHEARGLPNMDLLSTFLRSLCLCPPALKKTTTLPSRSLPNNDDDTSHHHHHHRRRRKHQPHGHRMLPTSDAYVKVMATGGSHHQSTLVRTFVFRNSEAPKWEVTFLLHLAHHAARLEFHVKDADPFGSDLIGVASLSAAAILATAGKPERSEWWLELVRPDGRRGGPPKPAAGSSAAIRISARFIPAGSTPSPWRLPGGGIPAYFPARRGCDVRLYQDADVAAAGGEDAGVPGVFQPGRCWEDMCLAVLGAQHLVYVAGWSVDTRVRLLRQAMSPEMEAKAAEVWELGGVKVENMSLGELLKYKSQEGVRVLLLVWDDKTSHDTFFVKTRGVMRTHDEDTKRFFRDSSVICMLSPRYPSNKLGIVVGTLYTHHQKCVLVDTPASETTRRVTAFLGGLDLCAGRYDTPSHTLFHGLHTVFHGDVYNPTFPGDDAANKGPRQPWHDMHCRLDGPAAYDVLENFEQRWRKTKKLHMREVFSFRNKNKKTRWKEDDLLKLDRISWILSPTKPPPLSDTAAGGNEDDDEQVALQVLPEHDPERWHAQIFRSVDGGSLKRFPRPWDKEQMMRHHLMCDKNLTVEQSIHTAYVSAIRSAERFVYVENQYFIGSSYAWPSYGHPGAANLVPMEIALKVAAKIRAGEAFAAYVVIPMWPEGDPRSAPAQEILFWQYQTMEMMYKIVAAAINDGAHPQQFLNFYCLGNRETPPEAVAAGDGDDDMTSAPAAARRNGRFMVYVHSKGMIVDDEYVIVGSANINQRSLAGSRDTEIAVGAYQPEHHLAGGKVFGYRMSLWEEHLGRETMARWPEVVRRPELRECVGLVNGVARENWERYTAAEGRGGAMKGHLMRYPVVVGVDGSVGPLQGYETFPDVGGRVLGSPNNLPDYLTM